MTGDRAWLNQLNRQRRIDPAKALSTLRTVENALALMDIDHKIRRLRTSRLKRDREIRDACLFCYGMGLQTGRKMFVYPIEAADFDFVAAWDDEDAWLRHFAPIQLKEVVPHDLNPNASIQAVVDSLPKYRQSEDLTVAIHVNRAGTFVPRAIVLPPLKLAALWLFGATKPDGSEWFLFGNMLEDDPHYTSFEYPSAAP